MNLIFCLDNNNGMAFNNRRQSRDKFVIHDIISTTRNAKLITTAYSKTLFEDHCLNISLIDKDTPLSSNGDYFFCELELPNISPCDVESVIIYRWNRDYPADVYFDATILNNMKLIESFEFRGYSHEKITREVYKIEEK